MHASLYSAELHYDGSVKLHTASSGGIGHLAELYLTLADGDAVGVGGVRINIAYLNGMPERQVVAEAIAVAERTDWAQPPAALLSGIAGDTHVAAPVRMLIDMALHDLLAKQAGQPLAAYLGAGRAEAISYRTNQTLFWSSYDDFIANATRYVERGFRKLKVRVGIGSFDEDMRRIGALRDRFGSGIEIAADANGAWSLDEAVQRLNALAPFDFAYFEQPIAAGVWDALAKLADESPIPVMLDESMAGADDVERVCGFGGRLLAHLKLVKMGGIAPTLAAARRLKAAGVPFMIGQMNEGGICTAAALNVAAATAPAYAELYGADGLVDDVASSVTYQQGAVSVPAVPGLGVSFDRQRATLIREF
ncbi:MAG: mandelate racemase/muconate lactonizing enzyme family protein [Proteobacteria bacterium]|nr:mandelate racemase/muconate lactonizing enzyme family protein [Pseudomonadota bacterium]